MSHGPLPDRDDRATVAAGTGPAAAIDRGLAILNSIIVVFAAVALVAACAILSYSVLSRALFKAANYWQDEAAVFLLVGAPFMPAAYVQQNRGLFGFVVFVGLFFLLVFWFCFWLVVFVTILICAYFN